MKHVAALGLRVGVRHASQDRPSSASLPLLQPEFIDKVGFADAAERLALTFTIPRDPRAPPMSIEHCESIVRCHQRLSYVEAEQSIAGGGGCEDVAALLQGLSLFTEQLEAALPRRSLLFSSQIFSKLCEAFKAITLNPKP